MKGKALGMPHSERVPEARVISENLSADMFWAGIWDGAGTTSSVSIGIKSWHTIDRDADTGVEAALVVETDNPVNVTHFGLNCDNSFSDPYPSVAIRLYHSDDGVTWRKLDRDASTVTGYFSSTENDALEVYVWVPRSDIKARFWKLQIPQALFASIYGDDTWHVSQVHLGTLDYFDDIVFNLNDSGIDDKLNYIGEAYKPPRIRPWISAGNYVYTGMQLAFLCVFRGAYGVKTKSFFLGLDRLSEVRGYGYEHVTYEEYRKTVSILTRTGFILGTSEADTDADWDTNLEYVISSSVYQEEYLGFGFASDHTKGCKVVRGIDKPSVVHGLNAAPTLILGIDNSKINYIYNSAVPDTILMTDGSGTEYPIHLTDRTLELDSTVQVALSGNDSGVVIAAMDPTKFASGTYIGDGTTSNIIDLGMGKTPRLFMLMRNDGAKYLYVNSDDDALYETKNGSRITSAINQDGDLYKLTTSNYYVNETGIEYLWWAFL